MSFQKGQSGNPGGRPKEKAFADAVRLVVNREHQSDAEKRKKLVLIAERLVDCAIAGESWAIQQVGDRLDGKPAQESTVTLDDKRDATDWTRSELVALLSNAADGSERAAEKDGRRRKVAPVH